MGLLTPKGKKGDKKGAAKNTGPQSKFIQKGNSKNSGGFTKKINLGGAQRGS